MDDHCKIPEGLFLEIRIHGQIAFRETLGVTGFGLGQEQILDRHLNGQNQKRKQPCKQYFIRSTPDDTWDFRGGGYMDIPGNLYYKVCKWRENDGVFCVNNLERQGKC